MSSLKIYSDNLSAYGRALVLFCKANDIDFEFLPLELNQGDSRKPDYMVLNPQGGVPLMDDDGFRLPESVAIIKYLAATRVPEKEHWYFLNDPKKRAQIDRILDWFANKANSCITSYGFKATIGPAWFNNAPMDAAKLAELKSQRDAALKTFNEVFLESTAGPFLLGPQMSIADVCLAPRFTQLHALADEEVAGIYALYPKLKAWVKAVQAETEPHWSAVHEKLALVKGKCDEWRASQA